jgi:hypothetical protein
MGAWGTAAFDNDDASDWVYDLEARGMPAIESALAASSATSRLATPADTNVIAAGEVIAAALGQPVPGLREDIQELVDALTATITPDHAVRARVGAERVLSGSELADLWAESPDVGDWQDAVEDLIRRLAP